MTSLMIRELVAFSTLDFVDKPGVYVKELGLLDIDYATTITVIYGPGDDNFQEKVIDVPLLGDNSVQTVLIDLPNVRWIKINYRKERCSYVHHLLPQWRKAYDSAILPPPTPSPTKTLTEPPTPSCDLVTVDFDEGC